MVQAPWPLSSNEQQQAMLQGEKNITVVEVGYKNTLQGIPGVIQLKVCVVQRIFVRQHNRDPGGFLGVMALLEQGVGLQWRLLLMCPACASARKWYMAHGVSGKPSTERGEERLLKISTCFES